MQTLLLLPLPPPYAGPESIAYGIIHEFEKSGLLNYVYVNSTIRTINQDKGKFNLRGLLKFLSIYVKFLSSLMNSELVFLYICSSKVGFLRDSIYILTASFLGKNIIVQHHGGNFDGFYNVQPRWYRAFIRFVLNRVTRLLVLGDRLRSMFDGLIPKERISILVNGVDPNEFPGKKPQKSDRFTVLFLGHLTFPKGFYDLIVAYKLLKIELGSNIQLIFAGERVGYKTALSKYLDEKWSNYFLSNIEVITRTIEEFIDHAESFDARYLGVVGPKERLEAFHHADLLVLPSYTEGLSMSCIEAMCTSLPIITTPVGAMPEIVIDESGGFITEIGSQRQLAAYILKLYTDRNEAVEMGRFNRAFVENHLTIHSVAKELLKIIQQVSTG